MASKVEPGGANKVPNAARIAFEHRRIGVVETVVCIQRRGGIADHNHFARRARELDHLCADRIEDLAR